METPLVMQLVILSILLIAAVLALALIALLFWRLLGQPAQFVTCTVGPPAATSTGSYTVLWKPVQPESEAETKPSDARVEDPGKPPPQAFCGVCGGGIFQDPVAGIDLQNQNYMAYDCPQCGRRTLVLNQ